MNLLIVESPRKASTISKFLDKNEFIIKSTNGHIRDLPKNRLGINIEGGFIPHFRILRKAYRTIKELKEIINNNKIEKFYLGTDFDREGESIAWHIKEVFKIDEEKINRITFHEITRDEILNSLKSSRKINQDLVNAQFARRILDRLVGYRLSPLLWKIAPKLSAGRVQSVALKFISEREFEIENFKPEEFWKLIATFEIDGKEFISELKNGRFKNKNEVEKIIEEIKNEKFTVKNITQKEKIKYTPPPLITSSLQAISSKAFNFIPTKTMKIAQILYEKGFITYIRTDSFYVSEYAIEKAREFIRKNIGENYMPEIPKKYQTKIKFSQEAHEAIRPTNVFISPKLTNDFLKLYELIFNFFIASQMKNAIYKETEVNIGVKGYEFVSVGRILEFDGFLKILPQYKEKEIILPPLKLNQKLFLKNLTAQKNQTQPPPRYTSATLIKQLERTGVGRPSTYVTIFSTLIKRRYIFIKDQKIYLTETGKTVNDFLTKKFSDIINEKFTSEVEGKLDEIAHGQVTPKEILSNFYFPFSEKIHSLKMMSSKDE